MSILETFYILFKSDASDVKRGAEEAEKSTKKLESTLKSTAGTTSVVGSKFLGLAKTFSEFLAVAVSAGTVLAGLKDATDYATQLAFASRALQVNTEELDAWDNAVKRTGGTVEGFQGSLRNLSQHLNTSGAVALKILPQLADVFHRLGQVQAQQYGKTLGLDEPTILLLQRGRREVEAVIARQKELGVVTKQDADAAVLFKNAQDDASHSLRNVYNQVAFSVIPALTKFYETMVPVFNYLAEHKDVVIGALIGIGGAAVILAAPFIAANAAIILTIGKIALLVSAFALLFEDIKYFVEGNDSLTGRFVNSWKSAFSDIQGLQGFLNFASSTPLSAQTSNSIINSSAFARNSSVNTGPITINTQATSAAGVAKGLGTHMAEQLAQANNQFANGVQF